MHLEVVIFVLSLLSTSAHPPRRDSREAVWADPDANQANDKTDELGKDVTTAYKTQVDRGDLYTRLDVTQQHNNPMVEEMRRKVHAESERLRARLRQELAELRAALSPTPTPLAPSAGGGSSSVLGLRRGLRPLSRQLQSTMAADTRELCGQLGLYLRRLEEGRAEAAEAEAGAAGTRPSTTALYLEAVRWMSQTLEDSGRRLAHVIGDFHAKASAVIDRFRGSEGEGEAAGAGAIEPALLQEMEVRWGTEVAWLKTEVRGRAAAVQAELAALLVVGGGTGTRSGTLAEEVASTVERFCHGAALQNQVFQERIRRLPQGLEVKAAAGGRGTLQQAQTLAHGVGYLPPPPLLLAWSSVAGTSSSSTSGSGTSSTLQEDFSAKLTALIQDILTSVNDRDT